MPVECDEVPERYRAEKRPYERKSWLYDHYWGQLMGLDEVAEECEYSREEIHRSMVELGVPRRPFVRAPETHEEAARLMRDRPTTVHDPETGSVSWAQAMDD